MTIIPNHTDPGQWHNLELQVTNRKIKVLSNKAKRKVNFVFFRLPRNPPCLPVWAEPKLSKPSGGGGLVAHSCRTLCDPMDCSLPGSSVHRTLQARILEWVAISFSTQSQVLVGHVYEILHMSCRWMNSSKEQEKNQKCHQVTPNTTWWSIWFFQVEFLPLFCTKSNLFKMVSLKMSH